MSFDPSEVLPWEAVAVIVDGELQPVPARELASPADAYTAPWSSADRHVADPALGERHRRQAADAEAARATRIADGLARGLLAPCASCESVTRTRAAARTPAGAVLCAVCAPVVTESAEPAPEAAAAPAAAVRTVPNVALEVAPARAGRAVLAAELPVGVELRRLAAAAVLTCTPLGAGRYRVTGGAEPHHVDLGAEGAAPVCSCADATFRGQYRCKHELAARAAAGEAPIAAAMAILRGLVSRGGVRAALPTRGTGMGADAHTRTTGALTSERAA